MSSSGVCIVKPEYVIAVSKRCQPVSTDCTKKEEIEEPPPDKKIKLEDNDNNKNKNMKKIRGRNKNRPKPIREAKEVKLCPSLLNHSEENTKKCTYNNCQYIHDPIEYLKLKPKDIDETCYVFRNRGECPRGLTCRFGSDHISLDGRNVIDKEKLSKWKNQTSNTIPYDVFNLLHKRKYDFDKVEAFVNDFKKQMSLNKTNNDNSKTLNEDISSKNDQLIENQTKTCGAITDEDLIKLRNGEKKVINWNNKLYLAPLTTVGNLPFRRICKEFGADITCSEMVLCDSLLKGTKPEWALVKRHESEDLFGVQICGNNPYVVSKTSYMIQKEIKADFVDLNLGCPIDLVYKKGGGCGMILRTNALEASIKCASKILSCPFTIKTRTGVYQDTKIAHQLMPKFSDWGVSMMTIHGRSREQRYTKFADWEYIEECAKASQPCPVFGNGDIMSLADYERSRMIAPSISGVMIARGALIKPWVFTEIKEKKLWDIRSSERFDILKKFANYGLDHWGSDNQGVETTRRFLLEWLSFLYRYVPVGLLESPPQRINERPPYYKGRDDLETLMASPDCEDWIKISTMLLGPVPEGFQFLPKHKANSFN